jgi:hypothetical protein
VRYQVYAFAWRSGSDIDFFGLAAKNLGPEINEDSNALLTFDVALELQEYA